MSKPMQLDMMGVQLRRLYCFREQCINGGFDGNEMSSNKHSVESEGSKPRDHEHPRHHFWKHAHRDWRVWCAVVLMIALVLVYVMSDNLSLRPGKHASQPNPEALP